MQIGPRPFKGEHHCIACLLKYPHISSVGAAVGACVGEGDGAWVGEVGAAVGWGVGAVDGLQDGGAAVVAFWVTRTCEKVGKLT